MSWSYSGDPSTTSLDEVRFSIGDTDTTDQQLSNEEVTYCITLETSGITGEANVLMASARACDALESKYTRQVDRSVGDLKITASQRAKGYRAKASELRRRALRYVIPYAGGISAADKQTYSSNTDIPPPFFTRSIEVNPVAGATNGDVNQQVL